MLRVRLLLGVAGLFLLTACAQTPRVTKVEPVSSETKNAATVQDVLPGVGLYYALPKTIICLDIPVTVQYTPKPETAAAAGGKAARARKGKKDQPEATLTFTQTTVTTESLPDPNQIYHIQLAGMTGSDVGLSLSRTENGLLNSIGLSAVDRKADILKQFVRYGAYIGAAWVSGGLSTTMPVTGDDNTAAVRQAVNDITSPSGGEVIDGQGDLKSLLEDGDGVVLRLPKVQGGTKKTPAAQLAANEKELATVKQARRDMLLGQLLPNTDGTALKLRLDGLEAYAKTLTVGDGQVKSVSATYKLAFQIDPDLGKAGATEQADNGTDDGTLRIPLLYFNRRNGFIWCPSSPYDVVRARVRHEHPDLDPNGEAFKAALRRAYKNWFTESRTAKLRENFLIATVEPVASIGQMLRANGDGSPKGDMGYYYREPGLARVKLTFQGKVVTSVLAPVAQFGTVVALPRSYGGKALDEKIVFYYGSGAIKSLAINSTARTAADVKDYYASEAEILVAAQKLKAAQEAKEKENATGTSSTSATQ